MPLYAGKYAICAFLQNMRNMLRSHDRYKPVSLARSTFCERVINVWNFLPCVIDNFTTLNAFKHSVKHVHLSLFPQCY